MSPGRVLRPEAGGAQIHLQCLTEVRCLVAQSVRAEQFEAAQLLIRRPKFELVRETGGMRDIVFAFFQPDPIGLLSFSSGPLRPQSSLIDHQAHGPRQFHRTAHARRQALRSPDSRASGALAARLVGLGDAAPCGIDGIGCLFDLKTHGETARLVMI
jgi:hypothetical protein